MKKSIVISILGGLMAAAPVMAANYDMYVTGSTAFRPNVFSAISKIFCGAPSRATWSIARPTCSVVVIESGESHFTSVNSGAISG